MHSVSKAAFGCTRVHISWNQPGLVLLRDNELAISYDAISPPLFCTNFRMVEDEYICHGVQLPCRSVPRTQTTALFTDQLWSTCNCHITKCTPRSCKQGCRRGEKILSLYWKQVDHARLTFPCLESMSFRVILVMGIIMDHRRIIMDTMGLITMDHHPIITEDIMEDIITMDHHPIITEDIMEDIITMDHRPIITEGMVCFIDFFLQSAIKGMSMDGRLITMEDMDVIIIIKSWLRRVAQTRFDVPIKTS